MTITDQLDAALDDLARSSACVNTAAVVSNDGLIMASRIPGSIDEDRFAAIASAMISLAARALSEFKRGETSFVLIKGTQGSYLIQHCCDGAMLVVMSPDYVKLGMLLSDVQRTAARVGSVL